MLNFTRLVIGRELLLAFRRPVDFIAVLFFFLVASSLFPIGSGLPIEGLRRLAPGALWASALLAMLLSLPRLFEADYHDGTLDQFALSARPLALVVFGKMAAHTLLFALPLSLLAPLLGTQFALPEDALLTLTASLFIGTPALSAIGALGAALTLGLRNHHIFTPLVTLPLSIPVLVFGVGAVDATLAGMSASAGLSFLAALSLAGMFFLPPVTAAALGIVLE